MKIGLVLFGHLRSYRETHSSFNLLKETLKRSGDVNVFCHTWDIEESVTASWWKENKGGDPPPATVNAKEIEEKYNPVRYIIEPSRQFDDSGYNIQSPIPVAGILSMLHTQQQAFQLLQQYELENGIRYDVILKARYDLLYEIAPGFNETISNCSTNSVVYLPSSNPYELAGSSSDIFAIGNREEMEKYFSFNSNFKEAIDFYKQEGYGPPLPEFCMTVYLDKIGVKRKELTNLRLHILRSNGEKFQINSIKDFAGNEPLCFVREIIKKNKEMLPQQKNGFANNSRRIIKKYMSWIDGEADEQLLNEYADFYNGESVDQKKIKGLIEKEKRSNVFTPAVMKNFFEGAMRNANYGSLKKFSLAFILYLHSQYGFFFFKVWKRVTFNK